jgi:hypothetical protein
MSSSQTIKMGTPELNINTILSVLAILLIVMLIVVFFNYRFKVNKGGVGLEIIEGTTQDNGEVLNFDGNEYYIAESGTNNIKIQPGNNFFIGKMFYINNYFNNNNLTITLQNNYVFRVVNSTNEVVTQPSVTLGKIGQDSTRIGQFIFIDDTTIDFIPIV